MKRMLLIRQYRTWLKGFILYFSIIVLAAACLTGCGRKQENGIPEDETVEVTRGDIFVGVTVDGSLVMPHEVELSFGTTGVVEEVLVKEGDFVREGTLLARLDNTEQKIEIEKVRYDLQESINNLETGCNSGIDYPYRYPDTSALLSFEQVQKELDEARVYTEQGYYKEAVLKIRAAYYDIDTCITMLNSQIMDVELFPDMNTTINYAEEDPDPLDDNRIYKRTAETMQQLQKDQERLLQVQELIEQGEYDQAVVAFEELQEHLTETHRAVAGSIGQLIRFSIAYPDTATSLDFLQSATGSITEMQKLVSNGDYDPVEFAEMLRLAQLDLRIGQEILEGREWFFESGLNLNEVQKYNLNLQKALAEIETQKQELVKTEILAPFDGMVVDIGVKVDDKLSGMDYSSRTAVKLVDTGTIKLEGIIDEVDIFSVSAGQKASIIIDAIPETELTGIIKFVSPYGTEDTGVLTFAVTIELDPTDIVLRDGLTATATIVVEDKKNVLLIPVDAVIDSPMGKIAIVIDEATGEGGPRPIATGAQDYQFAEVISGLEEGEKVIVVDMENLGTPDDGPGGMGPPPGGMRPTGGGGPPPPR
jgi:multidrug efflux pump subunit AcrA (membrane-fusion protein)